MHAPQRLRGLALEQVRAMGLLMRTAGALLLGIYVLLAAVAINAAIDARAMNAAHAGYVRLDFGYTPDMSLILAALALFIPLILWQDEDPTRRLYHWSMPVRQSTHALIKALAGWVWMMLAVVVFLIVCVVVLAVTQHITGDVRPYSFGVVWWEWLVPFPSVTIVYLFASAAAVGTRRPFIWIFGSIVIYPGVIALLQQAGGREMRDVARAMSDAITGYYGAVAAVGGSIGEPPTMQPSVGRWLGASAVWAGFGAALLWFAAARRPQPAQ